MSYIFSSFINTHSAQHTRNIVGLETKNLSTEENERQQFILETAERQAY